MLRLMAELDYAYLADFATVQEGKLSAIGASFTHIAAVTFPSALQTSIAGRVRTSLNEGPIALGVKITPPGGEYEIEFSGMLSPGDTIRPYAGDRLGVLFAFNAGIPLPSAGLYEVTLSIEGQTVRRLAFDVEAIRTP